MKTVMALIWLFFGIEATFTYLTGYQYNQVWIGEEFAALLLLTAAAFMPAVYYIEHRSSIESEAGSRGKSK